jgi:hypothetical protein
MQDNNIELLLASEVKEARRKLWSMGELSWKLDITQKKIYDSFYNSPEKIVVVNCSRRLGKCLEENELIITDRGLVPIKDIKIGDKVYGYNYQTNDVSLTNVIAVEYQGEKEVVDLVNNGKIVGSCTEDHKWLVGNNKRHKLEEKTVKAFNTVDKIRRIFINTPGGKFYEPHAYAIGCLLGDGCSRQGINDIHISSESDVIPKEIAKILNCHFRKQNPKNYTWTLSNKKIKSYTHSNVRLNCNYYDNWCKDRYAHEKIIDLEVVKTWNRQSMCALLAGLIDTDGSIGVTKTDRCLNIQFGSQSKSLIEAFQYLIHYLYQYKVKIIIDKRDKYVNGQFYQLSLKNNLICKRILKELDQYIQTPRKKWFNHYENLLENNTTPDFMGVKVSKEKRITKTYDITIDNDSHMYLTANGLVTHNSFLLTLMAVEQCLKTPNCIVKMCQPEQKMIRVNIRPIMEKILKDCPKNLKPRFDKMDNIYLFSNGSQLQLAGSDNGNAEKMRGGDTWVAIVDEAGFCSDLKYLVNSILVPTTTLTKGRILLSSTTPPNPDHEFLKYADNAEIKGSLIVKTIYDAVEDNIGQANPRITAEIVADIEKTYHFGRDSEEFQLEFLCKRLTNSSFSVIPEFTDVEKDIVCEWVRPAFADNYISMDIGFKDLTAVIFGYYDFDNGVLVIEDEITINGPKMTTDYLAKLIKDKEAQLWTSSLTGEQQTPYRRISDNNPILLNDLMRLHNITFLPTLKDNKEAQINHLRMMISNREIIIHPRCKTVISHLKNATWKKDRKDYSRSADNGHYDFLDCCVYLVRNIDRSRNPYPKGYRHNMLGRHSDLFHNPNYVAEINDKGLNKIVEQFKLKSTFRRK